MKVFCSVTPCNLVERYFSITVDSTVKFKKADESEMLVPV